MEFRTPIKIERGELTLNPAHPAIFIGSCFADNIASRMQQGLWNGINPCGALYNPFSIVSALELVLTEDVSLSNFRKSLFQDGEYTHSWLFDSKMSGFSQEECVDNFRKMRSKMLSALEKGDAMFITFGTAYCYYLRETIVETELIAERDSKKGGKSANVGYIVANCHKCRADMFERRRVGVEDIIALWKPLILKLHHKYPALKLIFTVSPVRHLKDGLVGNSRSKAILQLAVEKICDSFDYCSYFPAFEILNDDLRDYRFYASDLAHPTEEGVEYIWEVFRKCYLDANGEEYLKEGEKIVKLRSHRPLLETPEATAKRRLQAESRYADFLKKWGLSSPGA